MSVALNRSMLVLCASLACCAGPALAAFEARRIVEPALAPRLDGVLDDAVWRDSPVHDRFFEMQPVDRIDAKVRTEVMLAYDSRYLYVGVRAWDPDPGRIRAPFARRDKISADQDFIGLFIDPSGAGKAARMIYFNPRGALTDGSYSDTAGEDVAPDFDVEVATARFEGGWSAELRMPFSALAYSAGQAAPWKLLVMRNMTREQRYRMYSSPVTRSNNCSLCFSEPINGLHELPTGLNWSVTPQFVAGRSRERVEDQADARQSRRALSLDAKLRPDSASTIDLTLRPDFSQVELDAPQLSGNTRFGLFVQEKRPFFLEGSDMLQSPLRAINTRAITSPGWGVRYTRRDPGRDLTVLSAHDAGGGLVQLPNAYYTGFAAQNSGSQATVARVTFKAGALDVGAIGTDRTVDGGRGYNRVAGADFNWQRTDADRMRGQLLASATTAQPDGQGGLAAGARTSGHAGQFEWSHVEDGWSSFVSLEDLSDGFRADNGFIAQVGYRDINTLLIRKQGKTGWLNDLNPYLFADRKADRAGALIAQGSSIGAWMSGPLDSELDLHLRPRTLTRLERGGVLLRTSRAGARIGLTPGPTLARISLEAEGGDQLDVEGARVGRGATLTLYARVRLSDRIELEPTYSAAWTGGAAGSLPGQRWYAEQAAQLNGILHAGPGDSLRMILQKNRTRRNPAMYAHAVAARSDGATVSLVYGHTAGLGTAAYAGLTATSGATPGLAPARRMNELFLKLSWQI
jgi:hypothetical protein